MSKMKSMVLASLIGLTAMAPVQAEDDMAVNVSRITMDVANRIAVASIEACRKEGIPISVTVVDRNGIPQAQLRDTMAPPVSWGISQKKAYTAVMFNVKGSQLEGRANSPLQTMGEGLAFMAGSVPIQAGGKLYGAIGVSGAPDGMVDEKCAAAGLDEVKMDLEMM
ncbi:heme-binding protein [Hydrogenovibrio crunogenus]|uniref:Heme-binding protein n=1 Tax=Hydrogenovibrio crunogenus TaxID=39765 RepID=A0A4P7P0Y1_9GAMM|nr:heme-binding protein [Hydrogenovibrio crunogenus]QBZ83763.1 heme-binding protein [Hydrogenovibrio crunogenus]